MNRWISVTLAVAVISVGVVVFSEMSAASERAAWSKLAGARVEGATTENLESVREAAKGTSAEPWAAFDLAFFLYNQDTAADRERAQQVAQSTVDAYPDHAASKFLRELIEALETYRSA